MVSYRRWSLTRSGRYERVDCSEAGLNGVEIRRTKGSEEFFSLILRKAGADCDDKRNALESFASNHLEKRSQ